MQLYVQESVKPQEDSTKLVSDLMKFSADQPNLIEEIGKISEEISDLIKFSTSQVLNTSEVFNYIYL